MPINRPTRSAPSRLEVPFLADCGGVRRYGSAESIGSWLRRLDDRVVPDSEASRYTAPRPLWYLYGPAFSGFAGSVLTVGFLNTVGVERAALCTGAVAVVVGYLLAARKWQRAHREPPVER